MKRALFCLFLFLAGFSAPPFALAQEQRQARLVLGLTYKLSRINPFTTNSTLSANAMEMIFDTLVNLDDRFEMTPQLARHWSVSENRLDWIFDLHPEARFHDGTPLTAQDVKFSFEVLANLKDNNFFRSGIDNIREIRILSPHRVLIALKRADQTLPQFLQRVFIAPKHLFGPEGSPLSASYYQQPIGSGPFRVDSYEETLLTFSRNENYFLGRPSLEKVSFQVYDSERELIAGLINGEVDIKICFDVKYLETVSNIPELKTLFMPNYHLYSVFLNMKNPLFASRKVRVALNHAVDKSLILSRVIKEKGLMAAGPIPPQNPDYDADLVPYALDPHLALKLLGEEGWHPDPESHQLKKAGRPFCFTILLPENSVLENQIVKMIRQDLDHLGIDVQARFVPLPEFVRQIFHLRDFEAAIFFYNNIFGINTDLMIWSDQAEYGLNFSSYRDENVSRFLDQARYAQTREESRLAYQQYQRAIHDNPPAIFGIWKPLPVLYNQRVQGLQMSQFRLFRELWKVRLQ